jgi:hypothetical protein
LDKRKPLPPRIPDLVTRPRERVDDGWTIQGVGNDGALSVNENRKGRRVTITLNWAGIMSSRSDTSSPIRCFKPPQQALVYLADGTIDLRARN